MRLDDVRGFVFDLDGTLIHRGAEGPLLLPGAREVVAAVRASGRPLVAFTNGSHVEPGHIAGELRALGLEIDDDEVLTPVCSTLSYLERRHPGRPVVVLASPSTRARMAREGVVVADASEAEGAAAVFVAHVEQLDMGALEQAARAIVGGARLLTASYVAAYSGADGPIFSRGAMVTAALAKATGARPAIVGKPSHAALREIERRLGVPSRDLVVVGDDVGMDIALGRLGGARTVLVRSGISGAADLSRVRASRRPHHVVDGIAALLDAL